MDSRYPSVVLWICGLVFLGTGIVFTVMPNDMFATLGLTIPAGAPLTELRAVYDGPKVPVMSALLLVEAAGAVFALSGLVLRARGSSND